MGSIRIMVDSAADMTNELLEEYDIALMPLLSIFNEQSYEIGTELQTDKFYEMLDSYDGAPTTSQTPYARMYDILLEESEKCDTVIYLAISSKASGQSHTAELVRDDILENANPNADIRIIDTMQLSFTIGRAAIEATKKIKEGMSADDVVKFCINYMDEWKSIMIVTDLFHLQKGGRLSSVGAVLGTMLEIIPVISVVDGLVAFVTKVRGKKKLNKKLLDLVIEDERFDADAHEFFIMHSNKDGSEDFIEMLKDELNTENGIIVTEFGPLIGTHVGNNAVAVGFKVKKEG